MIDDKYGFCKYFRRRAIGPQYFRWSVSLVRFEVQDGEVESLRFLINFGRNK